MAKVLVKFTGSPAKQIEASTVAEALEVAGGGGSTKNYSAKVDGSGADLGTTLSDGQFVVFSEAVKGGSN